MGPKTEPILIGFDSVNLQSTLTIGLWSHRKLLMHSSTPSVIPKLKRFCMHLGWEALSNAMLKSTDITSTDKPLPCTTF